MAFYSIIFMINRTIKKMMMIMINIMIKIMMIKIMGYVAHCCTIFLYYLRRDDHHRNPNINDKDHLIGHLTMGYAGHEHDDDN